MLVVGPMLALVMWAYVQPIGVIAAALCVEALIAFLFLQYLHFGFEEGIFVIPYKKDYEGELIPIQEKENETEYGVEYKKDYWVLKTSLWIPIVIIGIVVYCGFIADGATTPISIALGATPEQIKEASNATFFEQMGVSGFVIGYFVLFGFVYLMAGYLHNGFQDGLFTIPYERDICGRKVPKRKFIVDIDKEFEPFLRKRHP